MKTSGKVVVVTGGANGLGAAIAQRFAADGASVVVADIEADSVGRIANAIGGVGIAGDMTKEEDVLTVADFASKTYGPIDLWHSNAGVAGPRQPGNLQDNELWDLMWNLHVMSHVYAARAVLPEMVQRGDGYLLATASSVALATQTEKVAYAVTKHGLLAFCEWLAVTYRPRGVKVSCFCPGPMLTRMFLSNDFPDDFPAMKMALTPEQAADVVARGIESENFLFLTQPGDDRALAAKGTDYDAWLNSMLSRYDLPTPPTGEAGQA
jgi:NAD(P)-dependent dehydrogenase (short-subunit alcohol dehydrogenase family)